MVEIRKARLGDDAALVAIDDATWSPHVTPAPRPRESDREFFDNGRGPDGVVCTSGEASRSRTASAAPDRRPLTCVPPSTVGIRLT